MASANTPVTVTMEVSDNGRWGFNYNGTFQEFTKVETPLATKSTQDATIGIVITVLAVLLFGGWVKNKIWPPAKRSGAAVDANGKVLLRPIDTAKGLRFTKVETQIV